MKIAIDLDDCLIATSEDIVYRLESYFGIKFDWTQIKDYSIEKNFCLDKEIVAHFVKESLEGNTTKPIENSVAIFNNIARKHFPAYIISHRRAYLYEHTKKRLDDLGFKNYELILSHEGSNTTPNKARIINELQIELVVEDRPDTILDLYKSTDSIVIIFNRPWNSEIDENERILRVSNWLEIQEYIRSKL